MWRLILVLSLSTLIGCSSDDDTDTSNNTQSTTGTPASIEDGVEPGEHVFVLPLSATEATWHDMAFLAAVPTSSRLNGSRPLVIAAQSPSAMDLPTRDYFSRLEPAHVYVLGPDKPNNISGTNTVHSVVADNASDYSQGLVEEHWRSSRYLVVANTQDYAGAVLASSLAAKLVAPLIYSGVDIEARHALVSELGVETVLWVSLDGAGPDETAANITHLNGVDAVLEWTQAQNIPVDYLALTNTRDRMSGKNQKLSLTAPMIAGRRGGLVLPIALDIPAQTMTDGADVPVLDYLAERYAVLGRHPTYLALVGSSDALPQTRRNSIFDNPVSEHPVSDLPYSEVDNDPFADLAIGRIVSDTIFEGSVLASRIAAYELLQDGNWNQRFIETGLWGFDELRAIMLNVGFGNPEHPSESTIRSKAKYEVSAVLHKDHSNCVILGNAFDTFVPTLLAPAVVTSQGCSVGGMDLVPTNQRTIVEHMLGQGAVAFMGATRNAIAENTLIHVSFWNKILEGQTIGQAFRSGINNMMVHWMDENNSSGVRYAIDIEILYGDPAMTFFVPREPVVPPASAQLVEDTVTVNGPGNWTLVPFFNEQLAEWNYQEDLFMYVGPGASPRTYWSGSYDQEDLYYGVNIDVASPVNQVEEQGLVMDPLGWSGRFHTDSHQDGTYTIRWRVRLLDYDMATGEIHSQVSQASYLLHR